MAEDEVEFLGEDGEADFGHEEERKFKKASSAMASLLMKIRLAKTEQSANNIMKYTAITFFLISAFLLFKYAL